MTTAVVYNAGNKEIKCSDKSYKHFSGSESADELATTLASFGAGKVTFQYAWLKLKYLADNGYNFEAPKSVFVDEFEPKQKVVHNIVTWSKEAIDKFLHDNFTKGMSAEEGYALMGKEVQREPTKYMSIRVEEK